jgi:hypothetical protein
VLFQQQRKQPVVLEAARSYTGDSSFAPLASASPIGHIPSDGQVGMGGLGAAAFDSIEDQAEQQAHVSRKRARGATGAPIPPNPYAAAGYIAAAAAPQGYTEERLLPAMLSLILLAQTLPRVPRTLP